MFDTFSLKTSGRKRGRMSRADRDILENILPGFEIRTDGLIDPVAVFGRHAPLYIEIGFGNGDFLAEKSAATPEADFIGIEIFITGAAKLLKKVMNASGGTGGKNLRIFIDDSRRVLASHLPDESIDGVYILFPDPWPKKRHNKRRLITPAFSRLLHSKLKNNGFVTTATDHHDYAEEIVRAFSDGFAPLETDASGIVKTKYARRAAAEGRRIHIYSFRKVP